MPLSAAQPPSTSSTEVVLRTSCRFLNVFQFQNKRATYRKRHSKRHTQFTHTVCTPAIGICSVHFPFAYRNRFLHPFDPRNRHMQCASTVCLPANGRCICDAVCYPLNRHMQCAMPFDHGQTCVFRLGVANGLLTLHMPFAPPSNDIQAALRLMVQTVDISVEGVKRQMLVQRTISRTVLYCTVYLYR